MRRRISRRRSKKRLLLSVLLLVLVGGIIGYASLNKTLIIEGETTVSKNVWNVRFENVNVLTNNAIVETAPNIIDNGSKVNFVIKLDKPGDSYSFTVDVVNNGDIDAMLGTTNLIDELSTKTNYLDYKLSYSDGVDFTKGDLLKKGTKDTIKFKVTFKKDITAADLETSSEQALNITLTNTYVQADNTAAVRNKMACKKAETLHTETCSRTSNGCIAKGYTNGATITYGHTDSSKLTNGQLTNGQSGGYALDCDVSGNGDYERFYYVSDLYTGTVNGTDQFDSDYAVLIYHKNIGTSGARYYYENSKYENWHGPVTLLSSLPTRSTWTNENIGLKNTSRTIYTETGTTLITDGSHNIENPFVYTDRVGRLLTVQEINKSCNITVGSYTTGELDSCEYLMEDSAYSKTSGCSGGTCYYWLETPLASVSSDAWDVNGYGRYVGSSPIVNNSLGVRPAVEILKSSISLE